MRWLRLMAAQPSMTGLNHGAIIVIIMVINDISVSFVFGLVFLVI